MNDPDYEIKLNKLMETLFENFYREMDFLDYENDEIFQDIVFMNDLLDETEKRIG